MSRESVLEAIQRGDLAGLEETLRDDPASAAARTPSGISAVTLARYAQRMDMVEILLRASPPLDVFEAAMLGNVGALRAVMDVEPDAARYWSPDGFTPLHLASFFGHPEVAALLLECGADARAVSRNPMQLTPLNSAAASRQSAIAGMLLERGADPNAIQAGGWTALHSAAHLGDAALCELLLEHGADPAITSDDGRDASAMAAERDHTDLAVKLRQSPPVA